MFAYQFFLDQLYPMEFRHNRMFGVDVFYYEDKIMFALRQKEKHPQDNGIWVVTKQENHEKLLKQIGSLKYIEYLGIKSWLMIPENHDDFETDVQTLIHLIQNRSPLIGNIPKPKKRKL